MFNVCQCSIRTTKKQANNKFTYIYIVMCEGQIAQHLIMCTIGLHCQILRTLKRKRNPRLFNAAGSQELSLHVYRVKSAGKQICWYITRFKKLTATISTSYNCNFLHKDVVIERDFPPRIVFFHKRANAAVVVHIPVCISIYCKLRFGTEINIRLCGSSVWCYVTPKFYIKSISMSDQE